MNCRIHSVSVLVVCLVLCATGGCTRHIKPDVDKSAFSAANQSTPERIPQKAFLVLTQEFTNYSYDYRRGMDYPYSWHVGPSLEAYSISMAERHFESVEVVRELNADVATEGDLVLTPVVHKLELTSFLWVGEKQYMTIDVEWTLMAKGKSNPIWMATSSGNSEGTQGTMFSGFAGGKKMIQNLVLDLWKQTDQSFMLLHQIVTQ